jgi:hypothetical protein
MYSIVAHTCDIHSLERKVCMCMYIMTSKLRLKYLVQNCPLLLVLKSSFIIFILLILIPTAFWLKNNQWYISLTAINIPRPDSKESCTVKQTRLGKVLCKHLNHVNCINLNKTTSSI